MTIDEAIAHAEWCADNSCGECAEEHSQLAEWLKELKQWKELVEGIDLRPESLMKPFQPNDLEAENDRLRELMWDLYCLAYPSAVEWEVSHETYNKYSPCEKCHELHGGKSPCASTAKDMTEECCAPIQANVVADRMRGLGIEVE